MGTPTPPATQTVECFLGHRIEKDHYHVQRITFEAPKGGIARQTVQCTTCGKRIRLLLASRRRMLWAVRIIFIVFGMILVLPGVALFFGSSDTPPNIGAGVGVTLAGLVVMALGFVFANFLVRREARGRFQVTMPMIRDSGFRQFMAVMVGNWARDLKHRLLVIKPAGTNYTTLLPSERSRGARWIGDLVRNRVMSIEESSDTRPSAGGSVSAPTQWQGGDPQGRPAVPTPPVPPAAPPPLSPPVPAASVLAPPPLSVPVPSVLPPPPIFPPPPVPVQPYVQPQPTTPAQPVMPPQAYVPSQPYVPYPPAMPPQPFAPPPQAFVPAPPYVSPQPFALPQPFAPPQPPVPTTGGRRRKPAIWIIGGSVLGLLLIGTITVVSLFPHIGSFLPFAMSATPTTPAAPIATATSTAGPIPTVGPALVDPLKTNSGTWMTQVPGCQFTNGGYQVSGALCMSKLDETDGAVAVDARIVQVPTNATDALTYGIMVRHAYVGGVYCAPTDGLEFTLDTHGNWGFIFTQCNSISQYSYSGSEARVGVNQTNTMLVCFAADHFTFYVNGVLIGSDADQVQLDGTVGLAANDLTGNGPATIVFSNFAYYAVCP